MRLVIRWNTIELGTLRSVNRFLWFPKCLENDKGENEWRWLEKARIQQRYCWTLINPFFENVWYDVRWDDDETN